MENSRSLRALPYALAPSLVRDLQAVGERWHVHVSVPRGTVKGIKMLGIRPAREMRRTETSCTGRVMRPESWTGLRYIALFVAMKSLTNLIRTFGFK